MIKGLRTEYARDMNKLKKDLDYKFIEKNLIVIEEHFRNLIQQDINFLVEKENKMYTLLEKGDNKALNDLICELLKRFGRESLDKQLKEPLENLAGQITKTVIQPSIDNMMKAGSNYYKRTGDPYYKTQSFFRLRQYLKIYNKATKSLELSLCNDYNTAISHLLRKIEQLYKNYLDSQSSQNIDEVYSSEKRKLELVKMFDYKELNGLAENLGFKISRHNGDHGIFKNDEGKVVIIPQGRDIGKGLSLKIQKSLGNS